MAATGRCVIRCFECNEPIRLSVQVTHTHTHAGDVLHARARADMSLVYRHLAKAHATAGLGRA